MSDDHSAAGHRLPRPRRDHADAAGGRRGDDRAPRRRRQRQLPARLRPARPPGGRGVARDHRAGARLPARRGGVHLRRHRGRQPRAQGHLLVPARRRPAPHPHPRHRGRAPRRARPAALARRARGRRGRAAAGRPRSGRLDVDALRGVDRARPRLGRAGLGDVGQQRGRHPAADRRGRRARRRARHPGAHRRRPGGRRGAGRLRRLRRRRADPDRAQGRRAVRRRRARRTPRGRRSPRWCTAAARSATSAAAPSTPRPSPASPPPSSSPVKQQAEHAARVGALRDDLVRRVARGRPRRRTCTATPDGRPAARQRPPRLPRLRGRLAADAARRPRHRVLDRLGLLGRRAAALPRAARDGLRPTRGAGTRCGSPSATPPPQADVDAVVEAIGPVVERARAAGSARPG